MKKINNKETDNIEKREAKKYLIERLIILIKATKADQEEITTTVKSSEGTYSLSISPQYIKTSMKEEQNILENITAVELPLKNNTNNDIRKLIQKKLSELPDFFKVAKKCLILRRGQKRETKTEKIMTLKREY